MPKLVLVGLLLGASLFAADFDVLIRGARVVDGSGNPWYRADVGVKDGKIAAIGHLNGKTATRTIEANNRVLSPGFIDVHTHLETMIEKVPQADNFLLDGVTTAITGNCGTSHIDLAEWFGQLDKLGLGINVASLIGHNAVRTEVMGTANRLATAEEILRMQAVVEKAMRDGAVGFATGLIYVPGTYSNTAEVVALAKAAAKYNGVYASHMRDEGDHVLDAITEAVTVGKEAGMAVELSHFKIDNRRLWGASDKSLDLVEKFRREGVDVVIDQYPYDHSSTSLSTMLPTWALADGQAKIVERLSDPGMRKKIVGEMLAKIDSLGQPDYSYAIVASFEPDPSYNGKNISEINVLKGRDKTSANEAETILDMVAAGSASMVFHCMGEQDVERIMKYPNTAVASDGWVIDFGKGVPHPRSYGTNARVLAEFVRTKHTLALEDAIRRMTSLPARTFQFHDRGQIREGFVADLLLFDPAKIQDPATFQKPHQYSQGFDMIMLNGKIAVENGKILDGHAGRVLRRSVN